MLGKKLDWLGKEAGSRKGKQEFLKKRNGEFSKNKVKRVGLTKLEIDARCLLRA